MTGLRRIIASTVGDRADLPTGTVTFLFTDIEGSTRLLDRLGQRYPAVLEEHQGLLRDVFSARGGVEIATEGDSFFVVFSAAPAAVAAAVEGQRALAGHRWDPDAEVRVRMGLHTGEGTLGADNYVGVDVHRAARIAATGHGGQVVVSAPTRALVEHAAPEGVTFRDLGEHRLKDLPHPEHLSQVLAEGMAADFPALRSMGARPNNLPVQLTSFVGRRRQVDEIKAALSQGRLLTLTGPGGTGKTRLSIQVASELLDTLEGGAFFVPLATVTDPGVVIPTVIQALGLPEARGGVPLESLIDHLKDKELLLVMDNMEQVLESAGDVGQILTTTESVRVLATSREPLGLHGEREYPVPPLALPDVEHLPPVESLSQFEAVALFVERATAVRPDFRVTNENAPAVAEICARLDGLPLAIELAAARVKLLGPEAMLKRLGDRLGFVAGGGRDRPARQQTLRGAIAWSYDLLEEKERQLFSRLAVFVGGFSLDSAEAVCNPGEDLGLDILEGVASLANKSLVRQVEGTEEPRFFMLETIREFAAERLSDDPSADEVRGRHAAHFLDLAERAAPEVTGTDQVHWLDLLSAEHGNLRAALSRATERGQAETALRLAAALWRFWQMRWNLRDGLERIQGVMDMPGAQEHPEALTRALEAAGGLAYWIGDPLAEPYYAECLRLRRELGDRAAIAEALYNLSFTEIFSRGQDERRYDKAQELLDESLAIFRELDDQRGVAKVLWGLGDLFYEGGQFAKAEEYTRQALEMHSAQGDRFGVSWDLFILGLIVNKLERYGEARGYYEEALEILADARDTSGIPLVLGGMASVAAAEGDGERAVKLAAAAAGLERTYGGGLTQINEQVEQWEKQRRELIPEGREYDRLWGEGEAMGVDQAVAYALGREPAGRSASP